jgi:hypothetical protein
MGPPASPCTHAGAGSIPAFSTTNPVATPGQQGSNAVIRNRAREIKPSPMLTVTDGTATAGFVLSRGPRGWESFDFNGRSLGMFSDQRAAVRSIPARKEEPGR